MKLLTQNSKLKKTSLLTGKKTLDFALPALTTCPYAKDCKKYCYANKGFYTWPVVKAKHTANFAATKYPNFTHNMFDEIVMSEAEAIRIHSSGDFYNYTYFEKWLNIIKALPHVTFYAYTKSIIIVEKYKIPDNLTLIYSFGGMYDERINKETDKHAIVLQKNEKMPKGYVSASDNDHVTLANNNKISLNIH